jgi:hypothetical protein
MQEEESNYIQFVFSRLLLKRQTTCTMHGTKLLLHFFVDKSKFFLKKMSLKICFFAYHWKAFEINKWMNE